ncbi:MAG: winged helix-turn-helix transcriptional regulator [Xanthomonadales bacterium]|nr:winged helix-turn-helix transcriptional regulator [Xanthomonadales bacterium]
MVKYEAELDAVFMALAHPARRAMLGRLSRGEATVGELAEPLTMSLPAVTKHLKVLERAHLISRTRQAQWRRCRLRIEPLTQASDWIEEQRQIWSARLDRLDRYLHELHTPSTRSTDDETD